MTGAARPAAVGDVMATLGLWRIWWRLGIQDLRLRFRRSVLGVGWILVQLVVTILAVGVVFGSLNWLVWAVLIVTLMGFRHGPTMDDITPLDSRRRALGIFALVLLFLLLPPVPLSVR